MLMKAELAEGPTPERLPPRRGMQHPFILMLLLATALITSGWAAVAAQRAVGGGEEASYWHLIGIWQIVLLVCWGQLRPDMRPLRQLAALAATVAIGSLIWPQVPVRESAPEALSFYIGVWLPQFVVGMFGYQLLTVQEQQTTAAASAQWSIRSLFMLTLYCTLPLAYYSALRGQPGAADLVYVIVIGGVCGGVCLLVLGTDWKLRAVGFTCLLAGLTFTHLGDYEYMMLQYTAWMSAGLILVLFVCRIAGYRIVRGR